jgi:TRAP-type mannitol/chloroaromatic compound transport system permease small subunit
VLYARLGRRARAWIDLIGSALFLAPFSLVMLWVSWRPIVNSWAILETSPDPGGLPRYPIKTVILISFFLLLLQAISQIVKNAAILAQPDGGSSGAEASGIVLGPPGERD